MKNIINYYYNLFPNDIKQDNNYFYFSYNNEKYYLFIFNRPLNDIIPLFELNLEMLRRNILVHEIILNKDRRIVTIVDKISYILMKVYVNTKKPTTLSDINYIHINTLGINKNKQLSRNNWVKLWSDKIDYFEYQINQMGKKYPLLRESLSYFIGLGENAISYIKNTYIDYNINEYNNLVVCHKRVKADDTLLDTNNPINFILDIRVRDISEYIKSEFFNNNKLWDEIYEYFKHIRLSALEYRLLYGRLLYPSFYFDTYEEIMNNNLDEREIIKIIDKINEYEDFLKDFYAYIKLKDNIPEVNWILYK